MTSNPIPDKQPNLLLLFKCFPHPGVMSDSYIVILTLAQQCCIIYGSKYMDGSSSEKYHPNWDVNGMP